MLDLRRLELLHAFAARGSIAATAEEFGYSPSAVSQQLASLERELGVALIERTAHSASLTDAGRQLAEHAATVLDAVEVAESQVRARSDRIAGRVNVSCIPSLVADLAPSLAALQRRRPELVVVALETESVRAAAEVLSRTNDLAVIDDWSQQPKPAEFAGLSARPLRKEPVLFAVPADHPAAAGTAISAAALRDWAAEETWLCSPSGHGSRTAGDRRLVEADARPGRRWEFEGLGIQADLVAAGSGIALLPAGVVDRHAGVVGLPLRPRMHRHVLALHRRTRQDDPALAACLAAVVEALAD